MCEAAYLQHMQKSGLSGIVESQEQELGVLVKEAQGGQDVPDYGKYQYSSNRILSLKS